jgi:hypothetical protein
MVSPDPLPLTISASSVTKTPGNTEKDSYDPEPAAEQDIQEYSSDQLCSINYRYSNKNYL